MLEILQVMDRVLFYSDVIYKIFNIRVIGRFCKINIFFNTVFRGFGGLQGMFIVENWIEYIVKILDIFVKQVIFFQFLLNFDFILILTFFKFLESFKVIVGFY